MICSRVILEGVLIAGTIAAETSDIVRSCPLPRERNEAPELLMEGVVPLDRLTLPNGATPLGSDVRSMIEAGRMEIRLRVEYDQAGAVLLISQYLSSPHESLPARQRPSDKSGSMLQLLAVQTDPLQPSLAGSGTFALLGSLKEQGVSWLGTTLTADTPVSLQLRFAPASNRLLDYMTVALPDATFTATRAIAKVPCGMALGPFERAPFCSQEEELVAVRQCSAPDPKRHVE